MKKREDTSNGIAANPPTAKCSRKTLDEAISELPTPRNTEIEELTRRYERCGTFYAGGYSEFAEIQDFREAAADAGHPEALMEVALNSMLGGTKDPALIRERRPFPPGSARLLRNTATLLPDQVAS